MWIKFYIFLGHCAILWNQYKFTNANPIVGENVRPAPVGRYNFIVSIMQIRENPDQQSYHQCMGSLITNRDVLTNEHCVEFEELNFIEIIVGSTNLMDGTRYFPLWYKTFDQWSLENLRSIDDELNDISIIRLTRNVTEAITPVPLTTKPLSQLYGLNVDMLGWGVSNTGATPETLEIVRLQILSNNVCEQIAWALEKIYIPLFSKMLCTSAQPFALMQFGDSGGPLMDNNEIVAVNGGTFPLPDDDFHPEKMNLHFSVDYYREFIVNIINEY